MRVALLLQRHHAAGIPQFTLARGGLHTGLRLNDHHAALRHTAHIAAGSCIAHRPRLRNLHTCLLFQPPAVGGHHSRTHRPQPCRHIPFHLRQCRRRISCGQPQQRRGPGPCGNRHHQQPHHRLQPRAPHLSGMGRTGGVCRVFCNPTRPQTAGIWRILRRFRNGRKAICREFACRGRICPLQG